jgi:hypothetical protein
MARLALLNRSVRTLQRLAAHQSGPPRIKIGRLIFYRIESVRAWLVQQEKKPAAGSVLPAGTSDALLKN